MKSQLFDPFVPYPNDDTTITLSRAAHIVRSAMIEPLFPTQQPSVTIAAPRAEIADVLTELAILGGSLNAAARKTLSKLTAASEGSAAIELLPEVREAMRRLSAAGIALLQISAARSEP